MKTARVRPSRYAVAARICAVAMAFLGLYLLFGQELAWWRVVIGLVLLACPVLVVWAALDMGRRPLPGEEETNDKP